MFLLLLLCGMNGAAQTGKSNIPTDKEAQQIYLRLGSVHDTTTMKRVADSLLNAHRYVYAVYGFPKVSSFTGDSLLKARYGILIWRGDCSPATGMNQLNGKMLPAIKHRFGDDIFDKTYKEGDSIYKAKHP